ncbi:MAG TPA: threonine--tRNA ligase [Nitrososphaerales archaeon]|nr:threonine--tRNA ligase [Nitrososphaerales archaeon]
MRILQQHLDFIEYEPISKEISAAEDIPDKKKQRYEEIVALFVSVEPGDDDEVAKRAVEGTKSFLEKLKVNRIIIYPYAHLSQSLARPKDALEVLKKMEGFAKGAGLETYRAPFGWNKAFQIKVKGHPLAEQSRVYSSVERAAAEQQSVAPPSPEKKPRHELTEEQLFARIKKSDFAGLPETDHRIIGERLDLFSFQEPSPGMVYWHDKGLKLRNLLIELMRRELAKGGYVEISTPGLVSSALWKVSGHWEYYKENMFLTRMGDEEFGLKPMNCPPTMLFYRTRRWSFRELPLRVSCFDPLYRNELSGVATGLFRVKSFSQDDAHLFVTEDQIEGEVKGLIDLMDRIFKIFGLEYKLNLSTMPDDHIGTKELWDKATETLVRVMEAKGLAFNVKEKDGTFYGPKIDVTIKDSMGREWQNSTIQLDYQLPQRFKLTYAGSDGKDHVPVVIHRAIYGSLERFIGVMIEHFQGKFPVWLSPVQVRVLPVSDENKAYAEKVADRLEKGGLRVERDFDSGTIGGKIRNAQLQKVPFAIVVGSKESEAQTISVRSRDGKVRQDVLLEDFVKEVDEKIRTYA